MIALIICVLIEFACFIVMANLYFTTYKKAKRLYEEAEAYKVTAKELQRLYDESKQPDFSEVLVHAEYCTSDSDLMKYSTQKAMESAIKSRLAMLIGNEMVKKFNPSVLPLGEGKEKYSLILKVREI